MNINEIEIELKKICKQIMVEPDFTRIDHLIFDHYDCETRTLVLYAKDATEALYISHCYSYALIEALEKIVGAPANIVCKYKPQFSEPHKRFSVQRAES